MPIVTAFNLKLIARVSKTRFESSSNMKITLSFAFLASKLGSTALFSHLRDSAYNHYPKGPSDSINIYLNQHYSKWAYVLVFSKLNKVINIYVNGLIQ